MNISLSHPEKLFFPESGITKREVAEYYAAASAVMLPHLKERPTTLIRCTKDISKACFYQKHWDKSMSNAIQSISLQEKAGLSSYILINTPEALLKAVQLDSIEFHPWPARTDPLDKPDRLIFDLDPGPNIAWKELIKAAEEVRKQLTELELISFVKLTGGKGLHVVVPLRRTIDWDTLKQFSYEFSIHLQQLNPKLYAPSMSKQQRTDKIFIDYLRNTRGATAVAPYSLRARPHAPVAMPLAWDELGKTSKSSAFTLHNALKKLAEDPWPNFFSLKQSITQATWKKLRNQ